MPKKQVATQAKKRSPKDDAFFADLANYLETLKKRMADLVEPMMGGSKTKKQPSKKKSTSTKKKSTTTKKKSTTTKKK
jgi:hypothetical protein